MGIALPVIHAVACRTICRRGLRRVEDPRLITHDRGIQAQLFADFVANHAANRASTRDASSKAHQAANNARHTNADCRRLVANLINIDAHLHARR